MLFKKNRFMDERIQKRSNELCARMFPVIGLIEFGFLVVKLLCGLPGKVYILEICTLAIGIAVWLAVHIRYGTLLVKEKDEILKEVSDKAKMLAFMAMFWLVITGEVLYIILVDKEYYLWVLSYLAGWVPCAVYITGVSVSEGLFLFGSKKKERNTKKALAIRTFIGSIFFGLFVGSEFYLHDGVFDPKGLLPALLLGAVWGIPFYFIFVGIVKHSEKTADKNIEKLDGKDDSSKAD